MAHYSFKNKFCFIHIPKTAGVSIRLALKLAVNDLKKVMDDRDRMEVPRDGVFDDHYTYRQCRKTFLMMHLSEEFDGLKKFCVIRNPWDRMVSMYNHRLRKPHYNTPKDTEKLKEGFTAWLLSTEHHADRVITRTPQTHWLAGSNGIMVRKFEDLDAAWIMKMTGISQLALGRQNASQVSWDKYKSFYDDMSYKHVQKHFEEDIRFGAYSF